MSISFPSLDDLLAGGEGGLDAWWDAVKDQISEQLPAARGILDQIDFVGLYQSNTATPSRDEIPFIPFRLDRTSVELGKSLPVGVVLGGRRLTTKKTKQLSRK